MPRQDSAPSFRPQIAGLVALAVGARWIFCFLLFPSFLVSYATFGDRYAVDSYQEIAQQLWAGNGYRTTAEGPPVLHRPPGYLPVLLLSTPAGSKSHLVFQLLNGVLGGLSTLMTWKMCRLWGASAASSFLAAFTIALWPFLVWETKVTVPENLLVALVPGTFVTLGIWYRDRKARWLLLAGALAAWATLTHGAYLVFAFAIVFAVIALERSWTRRIVAAGLVLSVALALTTPWIARNQKAAGRFIGVAQGFGLHYWVGIYYFDRLLRGEDYFRDHGEAAFSWIDDTLQRAGFESPNRTRWRDDPTIDRYLSERALTDITDRPGFNIGKTIVKMPLAWIRQQTGARSLGNALLLAPIVILAGLGIRRRLDWPRSGLLVALLLVNAGFAAVCSEGMPMRYVLPLMPLLAFWAALGLDSLLPTKTGTTIWRFLGRRFDSFRRRPLRPWSS